MASSLLLASGSDIRADMLRRAGVAFEVQTAPVDEDQLRRAMQAEQATPRDIADALAEMKATRVSQKRPDAMVLGCDQVLDLGGSLFAKPRDKAEARDQLLQLRGRRHHLWSAAVIVQQRKPIWRHVGQVRMHMRSFSDAYLDEYLERNWPGIGHSVGAYKLEEEGVRLMAKVEGDFFTVLGMPLLEVLGFLSERGEVTG